MTPDLSERRQVLDIAAKFAPEHACVLNFTPTNPESDWCVEFWLNGRARVLPVCLHRGVLGAL